jgi:germination protein M
VSGVSTAIPAGTQLLGISIDGGVATVDLTSEYQSGESSHSMQVRLGQVVYTLTQFPTVQSVRFRLDGAPVNVLSSEGIVLDHPVGRND